MIEKTMNLLLILATCFVAYAHFEKEKAFDSLDAELAKTDALLAEYRQELDTLHYSIYQTHLAEDL